MLSSAGRWYSFRQGVLLPASPVFDGFAQLMGLLYGSGVPGFSPLASLDDVGHYARVRMEFLKRLCTSKYGIMGRRSTRLSLVTYTYTG